MPEATIGGVSVNYLEKGSGQNVVLVHGFPLNAHVWDAQLDAIGMHYRVIAIDLPGFGQSPSNEPFSIESMADVVQGLMKHLKMTPAILAGLSMGGYVALAYEKKYPRTLAGLILVDTKAAADTAEARENRGKMIDLVRDKGSSAVADKMLPNLVNSRTLNFSPQIVRQLRRITDHCPALTIEHALAAMRDRPDYTDLLPSIITPTLIVVGADDAITPPSIAMAMQRSIPGASLAVIEGSGHLAPLEQPEQVNKSILNFLRERTAQGM